MKKNKKLKPLLGLVIEWWVNPVGKVIHRKTYRRLGIAELPITELLNLREVLGLPWRWEIELIADNGNEIQSLVYKVQQLSKLDELDELHASYKGELIELLPDYQVLKTRAKIIG